MNWFGRLRVVTSKERTTRELDEELQFHLDRLVEEHIAAGMSPGDARRAAQREFGSIAFLEDECRSSRGVEWVENLSQDLRYAFRNFGRRPGFAVAVVAMLAVGIGATAAVFSVVDRVLFRGLPYANAAELVSAGVRIPWLEYDFLTPWVYDQMRRDPNLFAASTSWSGIADCDITEDRPVRLGCARVESTFLPMLGIQPALGRNFNRQEDLPDVPPVALISQRLWKTRFGGDPGAVGRRLAVDGRQVLIVGVLPADFELPTLDRADVLMPLGLPPVIPASTAANSRPIRVYARLRPGLTPARARDYVLRQDRFFADIPPDVRQHVQFHVRSLRDLSTGSFRAASWVLLAAVLAMLSIACANSANLLLARSAAMRRELAIRVALGAGRARMIRQSLTESLLLSSAGGAAGCALAYGLLRVFVLIAPDGIPHLAEATLDFRVLLFGIAASLACGVAFGLAPALYTPGPAMLTGVRATASAVFARRVLVTSQLAVSIVLLTCAGILLQSFWNQQAVALGIRGERVVTAQLVLGARYGQPAQRREFYEKLEARIKRLPGIEAVALSDTLPPAGVPRSMPIFVPEVDGKKPVETGTPGIVIWRSVSPAYFLALGIPIVRGRPFTDDDRRPGERSIILSASYAKFLFGDEDPLGRRMCQSRGRDGHTTLWHTIVGVAADVRNTGLSDRNDPEYYVCRRTGENDAHPASAVILRAQGRTGALSALLRTEIASIDPALPVTIRTFAEHVGELAARPRFQASLLVLFAGIGLLIAALGLYGLVHFLVTQREREFGIRLALGATPLRLVRMILWDASRWTAAGMVIGVAGASVAARSLRSLLFHVSPADPVAYCGAATLLVAVALLAALLPSLRAARLDPATTLRHD